MTQNPNVPTRSRTKQRNRPRNTVTETCFDGSQVPMPQPEHLFRPSCYGCVSRHPLQVGTEHCFSLGERCSDQLIAAACDLTFRKSARRSASIDVLAGRCDSAEASAFVRSPDRSPASPRKRFPRGSADQRISLGSTIGSNARPPSRNRRNNKHLRTPCLRFDNSLHASPRYLCARAFQSLEVGSLTGAHVPARADRCVSAMVGR
jgi:hypothetical protein